MKSGDKVVMISEEELEYMKNAYKRATERMMEDIRRDKEKKLINKLVINMIRAGASKELVLTVSGISEQEYKNLVRRANRKSKAKKYT